MKILMIGDSPFLKTGFGIVNSVAVDHLKSLGHQLVVIGAQDTQKRDLGKGHVFYPISSPSKDAMGWSNVAVTLKKHKPDAVHIIADPATVCMWLLRRDLIKLPITVYMPIEGAPMNYNWVQILHQTPNLKIITCSEYGVEELKRNGLESTMAYHGVSEDFYQYEPEHRRMLRSSVGWDDKFIVMNVAQNVERKQWPRLFEAIKIVASKHPQVVLYAHTVPFDNYHLGGHDLPQLAHQLDIVDSVLFSGRHMKHNDSVALSHANYPGLVDLYNMADCFVLPSQVEGFGLPLVEAMACGLPVAHTNYGAGAEVVGSAGMLLDVNDWVVNKSHSRYANLSPQTIADAIEKMFMNSTFREDLRAKGIERAKKFSWDSYRTALWRAFNGESSTVQQQDTTEV
jgi:glycosyltransferase involved in cell wall biosynthesis